LEQKPHDLVHDGIGGLMGDPETAGYDPIFWLHHANIDRLWEVWRNTTPPHQNPADSSWLKFSFKFNDESGNVQTLAPRDVLDTKSAPFYYQYDDISQPVPAALEIVPPETAALMTEEPTPEMVGASSQATPLSGESQTMPVRLFPVSGPAQAALSVGGHFQKAYLHIENIRGKGRPPNYDVYINVPEGQAVSERFFVGTIPIFGLEQASIATERHPGNGLHFTFNITDTINFLKAENHWNPALLRVTFVPRKTPKPGSQIEVGRVSLYYT
jgi:tyrosinase